jgi:hypothetical protein
MQEGRVPKSLAVKAYQKQWRADHRTQENARKRKRRSVNRDAVRASQLRRYARGKAIIEELKRKPCADCGLTFPSVCMDFDHVRGRKKNTIGVLLCCTESLRRELAKCEVVCANCHRIRTWIGRDRRAA